MFLSAKRFFSGYARFEASGARPERFINLCARSNAGLWNVRPSVGGVTGCVRARDYRRLRRPAKKSGVRVKCTSKHGLPFFLYRMRRRTGLFAGVAVFCAIIIYLSQFVWGITVTGANEDTAKRVKEVLEYNNITAGSRLGSLDAANIRQSLLIQLPELAWMSINTEGAFLNVEVAERTEKPEIFDKTVPCNIIAQCDGHITSLRCFSGAPAVREGESVLKGDLLVSGTVVYEGGAEVLKHASAEIIAETSEVFKAEVPFVCDETVYTGKTVTKNVLNFFHLQLPLYLGEVSGSFEKTVKSDMLTVGGVVLPVGITTAEFRETAVAARVLNEEQALYLAREQCKTQYEAVSSETQIISQNEKYSVSDGVLTLRTEIVCKKNIAKEEKILLFSE